MSVKRQYSSGSDRTEPVVKSLIEYAAQATSLLLSCSCVCAQPTQCDSCAPQTLKPQRDSTRQCSPTAEAHQCSRVAARAVLSLGRRLATRVAASASAEGLERLHAYSDQRKSSLSPSEVLSDGDFESIWTQHTTRERVGILWMREGQSQRSVYWTQRLHSLLPPRECPCALQSLPGLRHVYLLRLQAYHAGRILKWIRAGRVSLSLSCLHLHNFKGSLFRGLIVDAIRLLTSPALEEVQLLFATASDTDWTRAWTALAQITSLKSLRLVDCRAGPQTAPALANLLAKGNLRILCLIGVYELPGEWLSAFCAAIEDNDSPISFGLEKLVLENQWPEASLWRTLLGLLRVSESTTPSSNDTLISDVENIGQQRGCLAVKGCRLGLSCLEEILKNSDVLDSLEIRENSSLGDECARLIGTALAAGSLSVSRLTIDDCGLRGRGVRWLTEGLKTASLLRHISVIDASAAGVGDGVCEGLWASVLTSCQKLETLNLSHCMLRFISPITTALISHECLTAIDLSLNPIGDTGAYEIACAIGSGCPSLRHIALRGCLLTDSSIAYFVDGLIDRIKQRIGCILALDMRDNRLSTESPLASKLARLIPTLHLPHGGATIPIPDGVQEV